MLQIFLHGRRSYSWNLSVFEILRRETTQSTQWYADVLLCGSPYETNAALCCVTPRTIQTHSLTMKYKSSCFSVSLKSPHRRSMCQHFMWPLTVSDFSGMKEGFRKEDYGKLKHKCDDISCSSCDCDSDYFHLCVWTEGFFLKELAYHPEQSGRRQQEPAFYRDKKTQKPHKKHKHTLPA